MKDDPYRSSPLQRRKRPTLAELADLDAAIVHAVATETPVTVRGVYYRVVSAGAVEKTEKGYQLGDHDPSGVDAWRSFGERVRAFAPGAAVEFERIAVTPEQIALYGLLTRPTKSTDSRSAGFLGESVEVDAIPASTLRGIVRSAIEQHVDPEALRLTRLAEDSERDVLLRMAGAQ